MRCHICTQTNSSFSTVLVVDDNRLVLEALSGHLRRYGFAVVAESDAQRALEILDERDDILALVCDFHMPILNGAQMALAAKQKVGTILVLIVSMYPAPMISQAAWDDWFCKGSGCADAVVQRLRLYRKLFSKDVVDDFGGEEKLLSALESLSEKLREDD